MRTNAFPGLSGEFWRPTGKLDERPRAAGDINPRERTRGEQLLAEIEAFVRRNPHWTFTRFGREALNNPQFVTKLQSGLNPEEITCRRVRKCIAENGG